MTRDEDNNDARAPEQSEEDAQQLSESARQAVNTAREQRSQMNQGGETVDEKGNLIPPQREESGMGGPADENWRAGQTAEQLGPYPAKE